ncbi:NAD-dependent epimerase/dehydratase family protein [Anaerocolumna sedimenticola]|uniref:NAD-dependent epimerase/dehydratase family protein n=1 Tax=Anaerocolumna sedimenticola TaxID=2696063 RepID=A0A6P1TKP8_9FIRM|nr:NAD-dependent epimerase/dehydratase family protein [Anaerocolumna sedimenticola]QHQ60682.1 NAD-dependent epimerase/dehydratase family protein [Anaerocolumna sedimenticola]
MLKHKLYIEDLEQINNIDIPWKQLENHSILITGGTGLIGSVLVDSLIYRNEEKNAGIDLWVLTRNEEVLRERFGEYLDKEYFHYLIQDVSNQIDIDDPIDFIIHGASKGDPYSFAHDPVGVMNANYLGTYQVLELARRKNCTKVLFISSGEVYGIVDVKSRSIIENGERGIKETEYGYLDVLNPRSCYASSKRAAETLCLAYINQYSMNVCIARPCHTYSATMLYSDKRVIGEFIRHGLQKQNIIMKSEGTQLRSYCYVADTATGVFCILLNGESCLAYNIANRNSIVTIKELAYIIAKKSAVKVRIIKPGEVEKKGYSGIEHAVLDPAELEKLGWQPRYDLPNGIDRIVRILSEENKQER